MARLSDSLIEGQKVFWRVLCSSDPVEHVSVGLIISLTVVNLQCQCVKHIPEWGELADASLIILTHALIKDPLAFDRLELAEITEEEHGQTSIGKVSLVGNLAQLEAQQLVLAFAQCPPPVSGMDPDA